MVTIDILASPSVPGLNQPAVMGSTVTEVRTTPGRLDEGAVRTLVGFLWAPQDGVNEVLRKYPDGHPRLSLAKGLFSFLLLLLPPVFVGMNLGATAWISDRVSFRTPKDGRLVQLLLSWALTPFFLSLVVFFSTRTQAAVLFHGQSPFLILLPAVPLLFVASLGWRAAAAATRRREDQDPELAQDPLGEPDLESEYGFTSSDR
jgi:hypothetical protein